MTPKVSIAIPAYKSTFLRQAIDSVLAQTFSDWELIIVNDASPEPVSEIVKGYTDTRIRYYVNETNIGMENPAINWNRCLELAQGEFFCLLCDDDYYEPTFLGEMLALADKYPDVSVFRSRAKIIDENNQVLDYYPSSPKWESCLDYVWHKAGSVRRQSISEFFLRRKYICSMKGYVSFPKAWFSDEVSIYLFSQENGIVSTNQFLSMFRISQQSITGNDRLNIRQKIEAFNTYIRWIKSIIIHENDEYVRIILQKTNERKKRNVIKYLVDASWKDFVFLWLHRKSEQYNIYSILFFDALVKRLAHILKNKCGTNQQKVT